MGYNYPVGVLDGKGVIIGNVGGCKRKGIIRQGGSDCVLIQTDGWFFAGRRVVIDVVNIVGLLLLLGVFFTGLKPELHVGGSVMVPVILYTIIRFYPVPIINPCEGGFVFDTNLKSWPHIIA